jgi:hypothetical protein
LEEEDPAAAGTARGVDDREGVDMDKPTGGHYLDTGQGPRPLTVVGGSGLLDEPQMVAYQTYLGHAKTCTECPQSAFQCAEAGRLYEAYRQVRG